MDLPLLLHMKEKCCNRCLLAAIMLLLFNPLHSYSQGTTSLNTQRYMKVMKLFDRSKTLMAGGRYANALENFELVIDDLEPVEQIEMRLLHGRIVVVHQFDVGTFE